MIYTGVSGTLSPSRGGTNNYENMENKPTIEGVTVEGALSAEDLGLEPTLVRDDVPTMNSDHVVKSGGVYSALTQKANIEYIPEFSTNTNMSDWTVGKVVDAAVLKTDFLEALGMLEEKVNRSELAGVATSGSYADLSGKPTTVYDMVVDVTLETDGSSGYDITSASHTFVEIAEAISLSKAVCLKVSLIYNSSPYGSFIMPFNIISSTPTHLYFIAPYLSFGIDPEPGMIFASVNSEDLWSFLRI